MTRDDEKDRQCAYTRKNAERSRNQCCHGNAISIKYSVCVSADSYPECKAHALYCIDIRGLSGCNVFFPHYLIKTARLSGEVTEHKMCFDFMNKFCLKHFSC